MTAVSDKRYDVLKSLEEDVDLLLGKVTALIRSQNKTGRDLDSLTQANADLTNQLAEAKALVSKEAIQRLYLRLSDEVLAKTADDTEQLRSELKPLTEQLAVLNDAVQVSHKSQLDLEQRVQSAESLAERCQQLKAELVSLTQHEAVVERLSQLTSLTQHEEVVERLSQLTPLTQHEALAASAVNLQQHEELRTECYQRFLSREEAYDKFLPNDETQQLQQKLAVLEELRLEQEALKRGLPTRDHLNLLRVECETNRDNLALLEAKLDRLRNNDGLAERVKQLELQMQTTNGRLIESNGAHFYYVRVADCQFLMSKQFQLTASQTLFLLPGLDCSGKMDVSTGKGYTSYMEPGGRLVFNKTGAEPVEVRRFMFWW